MIFTNRGKRLFENAESQILKFYPKNEDIVITYFDTENLSIRNLRDMKEKYGDMADKKIFHIISDRISWVVDDKREFSRVMMNSEYLPLTYLTREEFFKDKDLYNSDKVWFVKRRGGSSGKYVNCVKNKDITSNTDRDSILQEEIHPIDLWNGRKYVIRSYILLWNKKAWLHRKAFCVVHGKEYEENSSDWDVQVNHNGYCSQSGLVKLHNLEDLDEMKGKSVREEIFIHLYKSSKEIAKNFKTVVESTTETQYIILGVDSLPIHIDENKYSIRLVEVNRFPNICHTQKINKEVNEEMLKDTLLFFMDIKHPFCNYVDLS